MSEQAAEAAIGAACQALHLPTVGCEASPLADQPPKRTLPTGRFIDLLFPETA